MPRPRVVLVPGFTQTPSSWRDVAARLDDAEVVTPEVPVCPTFAETALAIGDACGRARYAGYSMGGRLCLRLALERPDLVEKLVLISATPGLRSEDERAGRIASDEQLAQAVERDGVEAFIEQW